MCHRTNKTKTNTNPNIDVDTSRQKTVPQLDKLQYQIANEFGNHYNTEDFGKNKRNENPHL